MPATVSPDVHAAHTEPPAQIDGGCGVRPILGALPNYRPRECRAVPVSVNNDILHAASMQGKAARLIEFQFGVSVRSAATQVGVDVFVGELALEFRAIAGDVCRLAALFM